jgi:hypothetical protein
MLQRDLRRVIIWRSSEEERERDPERGEACRGSDVNQRRLDEDWLRKGVLAYAAQYTKLRHLRVLCGVVWQHPVHAGEHRSLNGDSDIEDEPPGRELSDDTANDSSVQNTEEEGCEHDGDGSGSAVRRGQVGGERVKICGTTENTPTRKDRASNTTRLDVTARPIDRVVVKKTSRSMRGRRRTRSPRGDISSRPAAYL